MLLLKLVLFSVLAFSQTTFRVRLAEDLGTLDWNYGEVNGEVVYQLMEGLFRADRDGKPVKAAAASYQFNFDKTAMVIFLRPDRVWSDGQPLCAQHFVDSWERLRSKEFASPYGHYAGMLDSLEVRGCRELRVKFKRPVPEAPAFFANLVFFPIRVDQPVKAFTEGTSLLVNGPFRVKEWKRNSLLVLEKNPKYAGARAHLDRVEYRFIPEDSTAKAMFERGEIDWVKDVAQLLRTPELEASGELRVFPALIVYYFGLNAGKTPLLRDPDVRRLFSDSLNRKEIPRILGKEYRSTQCWVAQELLPCKRKAAELNPIALKKLREAGPSGIVLRVYSKTQHKMLAEWAQAQWEKKLGVRIPIEVQESKVYWKEIGINPAPIFLSGVTAPFGHPRAFLQEFLSGGSANWTGWASSAFDLAVLEGKSSQAEKLLEQDAFVIPLYQRDTVALVKKKWKGFWINPLERVYLSEVN